MTQTKTIENNNSGYFTSNHLKPQPTTTSVSSHNNKSGLLNGRQQQQVAAAAYLPPELELPSLPPLSQLLLTDVVKNEESAVTTTTATTSDVVATVVANGMIQNMNYTTNPPTATVIQGQPIFYNNNDAPVQSNDFVTTVTGAQFLDPQLVDSTVYNATDIAEAMMNDYPLDLHQYHQSLPKSNNNNNRQRQLSNSSTCSSAEKTYSFVSIPGTNQRKRPRRRYDEIERLYNCNFPACTKAYGTLNHLNAHVSMQKHGAKRHPSEFKEMRKEWRRQKKEREAHKKVLHEQQQQNMIHQPPTIPSNTMTSSSYPPPSSFQPHQFRSATNPQRLSNGTSSIDLNEFY